MWAGKDAFAWSACSGFGRLQHGDSERFKSPTVLQTSYTEKKAILQRDINANGTGTQLDQMRLEKPNIPLPSKSAINTRFRNSESDIDALSRKLASLSSAKRELFGSRYTDDDSSNPTTDDQLAQRQQLLSGTDRLGRSSQRLRESQRIALETEEIGRNTLGDLHTQREQIERTRNTLLESEGYTDRSIKTLRGMARR